MDKFVSTIGCPILSCSSEFCRHSLSENFLQNSVTRKVCEQPLWGLFPPQEVFLNSVFHDIFGSPNCTFFTLKFTAGACYGRKIPQKNSRRSSKYLLTFELLFVGFRWGRLLKSCFVQMRDFRITFLRLKTSFPKRNINGKFWKKSQMFACIASIDGINSKFFHQFFGE